MKLLFIWINENSTGIIHQQGFNFDVKYRFSVLPSADHNTYQLVCECFPEQFDIWDTHEITGLTALVGENGVGKTSLLHSLYITGLLPIKQEHRPGYAELDKKMDSINKKILIYQIDDGIIIYHNFLQGELLNKTEFISVNINELNAEERIKAMEFLEQQTVIYLSNSGYSDNFSGYSTHAKLNNICLTPSSLKTLSNSFYNKITMKPQGMYVLDRFFELQNIIRKVKSSGDFQEICDICYYHYVTENKIQSDSLKVKRHSKFEVSFYGTIELIRKLPDYSKIGREDYEAPNETLAELNAYVISYLQWRSRLEPKVRTDTLCVICLNLIFEMCYVWKIQLPDQKIKDVSDCLEIIKNILSQYDQDPDKKEEQLAYYKNGQAEILSLLGIIKDCPIIENLVPQHDLAYRMDRVVDSTQNTQLADNFCACVDLFAQAKNSVVLKYIHISNLKEMSSGERALQNLFSWLLLPPRFDRYLTERSIPIRGNILLLVDEIDLYMHPEWQRQCLKKFSDDLKLQFPGKCIQIIVSTHSPLVLSDIPVQNTIYLVRDQNGTQIAKRDNELQTFGANIHKLLDDAFFLDNTMGAYAYAIIKEVADSLLHLVDNLENQELKNKCRPYSSIIAIIGDPLIKHKLSSLYENCFPELQHLTVKDRLLKLPQELKSFHLDKAAAMELKDALELASAALDELL